ncbi:7962_t:CDS:2, partial [Gigaspora margarita]
SKSYQKQKARDLSCIFKDLVKNYRDFGLSSCEMEERKYWNASGPKAAEKLLLFQTYIPELANYFLESHSLCQTHDNQIVLSNLFYKHLSSLAQETQLGTNMNTQTTSYTDLANKLDRTKKLLESAQKENMELGARIERNWQYLEEQANEAEELKKQLQQTREEFEKNKTLTEQWNSRFSTRQNHIDAIIEIANAERKALFDDIY